MDVRNLSLSHDDITALNNMTHYFTVTHNEVLNRVKVALHTITAYNKAFPLGLDEQN